MLENPIEYRKIKRFHTIDEKSKSNQLQLN